MTTIKIYNSSIQSALEACFKACVLALGWAYEPDGRHSDIVSVEDTYIRHGCFWCLFEEDVLIGMAAARCIDTDNKIAELKRLYILPDYQGRGYGGLLFKHALDYVKEQGYLTVRVDTRHDRAASLHLIEKYRFRQTEQYNDNQFAELFYELNLNEYESEETPCR